MPDDTETLHQLAANYRAAEQAFKHSRQQLDAHIQQLKRDGWAFRELAKQSGLAQGTIQNIIAEDPQAPQYWRKRCTRKTTSGDTCDEIWLKNTAEWCPACLRAKEIEDSAHATPANN